MKKTPQQRADRSLCPVAASAALGLKVHDVAEAMRAAGVTEPITVQQAKAWRAMREDPPPWVAGLLASAAASAAEKAHHAEVRHFEDSHRMLLLREQVEQRLLAGKAIRGSDAEFSATDIAFRAMKELVRCDGDVSWLLPIDLAGLRWAGVDPADRRTWFLERGGAS